MRGAPRTDHLVTVDIRRPRTTGPPAAANDGIAAFAERYDQTIESAYRLALCLHATARPPRRRSDASISRAWAASGRPPAQTSPAAWILGLVHQQRAWH